MKRSCSIGKVAQAVLDPRCDGIRDVLIALDDPVKAHEEAIAMGVGVIGVEVCGPDVLKKKFKGRFQTHFQCLFDPAEIGVFMTLGQLKNNSGSSEQYWIGASAAFLKRA